MEKGLKKNLRAHTCPKAVILILILKMFIIFLSGFPFQFAISISSNTYQKALIGLIIPSGGEVILWGLIVRHTTVICEIGWTHTRPDKSLLDFSLSCCFFCAVTS